MTYPDPYINGLYPDVMIDVRDWLRAHPYLTALQTTSGQSLLNRRVFLRIPKSVTYPLIRVYDAGTVNQTGEAPLEDAQIGLDIWGADHQNVADISRALKAAWHLMPPGTMIGATTVGLDADVIGSVDSPDPDTGNPRKIMTVALTCRVRTANDPAA